MIVSLALALAAFGSVGAAGAYAKGCKAKGAQPASVSKRQVVRSIKCLLNKKRTKHGLHALHGNGKQRKAAKRHNKLMVRTNCFEHLCPGEGDLVSRLTKSRYLPCGSCSWKVGENIAWGTGHRATPKAIVRSWMHSPPHRRNILDPAFRQIGIAVHHGNPVSGVSGGATYTTDFGYRG